MLLKPTAEVVATFPAPGKRADVLRHVRSTLVTSGLGALRQRGRFDEYAAALDPASRDRILGMVAGVWLPVDLVAAHYRACDALQLTHDQVVAIGVEVGARAQDNVLQAIKRIAAGVGVTPWTLAAHYDRLWPRMFDGGGFRISRLGPKDGVIELQQCSLIDSPYFRAAFCGVNLAALNLLSIKAYVRVHPRAAPGGFAIRLSWV